MDLLTKTATHRLQFHAVKQDLPDPAASLSAITTLPDGTLWLAADETCSIERLLPQHGGGYAQHISYPLTDLFGLPGKSGTEIDIEGLCYHDPYLWIVGSHASKFRKKAGELDFRADKARLEPRRCFLARVPIHQGWPCRVSPHGATAAMLKISRQGNRLRALLAEDPILHPYCHLPAKANGLDVEGIAVMGDTIFLGLRSPVLSHQAVVVEVKLETHRHDASRLSLRRLNRRQVRYRLHFLDTSGLGIRDLLVRDQELFFLLGPAMSSDGPFRLGIASTSTLGNYPVRIIGEIPCSTGGDRPEGICWAPNDPTSSIMVVYDSPAHDHHPQAFQGIADQFSI